MKVLQTSRPNHTEEVRWPYLYGRSLGILAHPHCCSGDCYAGHPGSHTPQSHQLLVKVSRVGLNCQDLGLAFRIFKDMRKMKGPVRPDPGGERSGTEMDGTMKSEEHANL